MNEKLSLITDQLYLSIADKPLARFLLQEIQISQRPAQTLRKYTGLKQKEIAEILFNPDRDIKLPIIIKAIKKTISKDPKADKLPELPENITLKEISRQTGFSPEQILKLINEFKPSININGISYCLNVNIPEVNDKHVLPKDIKKYGLKPKRVLKRSRYESRSPGGGPIQRTRLQKYKITNIVKREVVLQARLVFTPENKKTVNEESGHQIFMNNLFQLERHQKKSYLLLRRTIN